MHFRVPAQLDGIAPSAPKAPARSWAFAAHAAFREPGSAAAEGSEHRHGPGHLEYGVGHNTVAWAAAAAVDDGEDAADGGDGGGRDGRL